MGAAKEEEKKNEPIYQKWNGQDAVKRNGIYLILARCADADISVSFRRCPVVCAYVRPVANIVFLSFLSQFLLFIP